VIEQYRVTRDEKGNVVSDPNRLDDEQYIVRLIGQVITVSLNTMQLVEALPPIQPTAEESKAAGKPRK
jgi:predicted helicase